MWVSLLLLPRCQRGAVDQPEPGYDELCPEARVDLRVRVAIMREEPALEGTFLVGSTGEPVQQPARIVGEDCGGVRVDLS
jgi:hypothetical protein